MLLRSWLNAVTSLNMKLVSATKLLRSPLNATVSLNMEPMSVTSLSKLLMGSYAGITAIV